MTAPFIQLAFASGIAALSACVSSNPVSRPAASTAQDTNFQPVLRRFDDFCLKSAPDLSASVTKAQAALNGAPPLVLGDLTVVFGSTEDISLQYDKGRQGCVVTTSQQKGGTIATQFAVLAGTFAARIGGTATQNAPNTYAVSGATDSYRLWYDRNEGELLGIERR